MSKIFKNKIDGREVDHITCDVCNKEIPIVWAMEFWITHEGKEHCLSCQRENKIGIWKKKKWWWPWKK